MRFRVDDDAADSAIDEIVGVYRHRGVPLVWIVHPTSQPKDLGARLSARGLEEAEIAPGMVARIADVPSPDPLPDGVELERLAPGTRLDYLELVAWRYSLPDAAMGPLLSVMQARQIGEPGSPTVAWVARMDGTVVSKATLHVGGGVAGIYGVATKPEARGLGLARTLTTIACDEARRQGVAGVVLHSTPMAFNLYRSLGFEQVTEFRLYAAPGDLHL
jgi:ribosomal protein S18 acetylase RimI-like enzyme